MDYLEAYHLAQRLIKKAGFRLATVSGRSEACYYTHPFREPLLLRLATHPQKKGLIGLRSTTVARLTFSPRDPSDFTDQHVHNLLSMAIGRYFLDDPKPSDYFGRKGTWEQNVTANSDDERERTGANPEAYPEPL